MSGKVLVYGLWMALLPRFGNAELKKNKKKVDMEQCSQIYDNYRIRTIFWGPVQATMP